MLGLLGFLANPLLGIGATLATFIFGSKVAQEKRRVRAHKQLIAAFDKATEGIYANLEQQIRGRLRAVAHAGRDAARGRLEALDADLDALAAPLGGPVSPAEDIALKALDAEIDAVVADASRVAANLLRVISGADETREFQPASMSTAGSAP